MRIRPLILAGSLAGVFLPLIAGAQPAGQAQGMTYTLLAPFGTLLQGDMTISTYLTGMFMILIGVSGILAVVMIVICGIKYMGSGDNSGARSEAKDCIKNALFGVLIAIGAWVLLNTINPLLLTNDFIVTPQDSQGGVPSTPKPGRPGGLAATTEPVPSPTTHPSGYYLRTTDGYGNTKNTRFNTKEECDRVSEGMKNAGEPITIDPNWDCKYVESQARPIPQSEKDTRMAICGNESCVCNVKGVASFCPGQPVSINKQPCTAAQMTETKPKCTNVAGIPDGTIDFIKNLSSACGCQVLISGGTEPGHKTHAANAPIFDLRLSHNQATNVGDKLYNLIKGGDPNTPTGDALLKNDVGCQNCVMSFAGNKAWLYDGYYFTDEKSAPERHWHVCREDACRPKLPLDGKGPKSQQANG